MNRKDALSALEFWPGYIDEINYINSEALIAIVNKDLEKLKYHLYTLILWRCNNDDILLHKVDYQEAIEYFIDKLEKGK